MLMRSASYYRLVNENLALQSTSPIFCFTCRSEGPDEPVPVLSVPGRRDVRLLLLSAQLLLHSPVLQTGPPDVVEVDDKQIRCGYLQGISALLGVSDHDHLRGEVRVRFSAPPSDVVDQNPHDGCHRLHHHGHDSYNLSDVSSQGTMCVCFVVVLFSTCFRADSFSARPQCIESSAI